MTEVHYIILAGVIIIAILIGLAIYSFKKTKRLRLLGYDCVYYFMSNCDSLEYYRDHSKHLNVAFQSSYEELVENRNKWYLFFGAKLVIEELIGFIKKASSLTEKVAPLFSLDHYFAYSEHMKVIDNEAEVVKEMLHIVSNEFRKYIEEKEGVNIKEKQCNLQIVKLRVTHNHEFVRKELRDNEKYFDTLLKYPLDKQQRQSIVILEDNCLVISSAGSGKTSTSIAKVKYLLDKRHLSKDEILVLSYNRKTAEEFQERLNIPGLTCKTFHALALQLIGEIEKKRPDVCEPTFLLTCYYNLVKRDLKFKEAVTKYVTEIASLTKLEHEYNFDEAEKYYEDRETYGIMAPYGDMNGSPVFTRSEEEKKICTWLSSHGVDFLYEQQYPIVTANERYRQYKPDFTIYYEKDGKRFFVFLEHFGIDKNSRVPEWFGAGKPGGFDEANRKYNEDIIWKRGLHRENNTCLLETTSAMFHDGTVFQKLEQQLKNLGIPCIELSEEEKYKRLFERNKAMEDSIMNLFSSFISLMKSNGKSFDDIMQSIIDSGQTEQFCERCRFLMYEVIKPLYDEYETALAANGQMDFTDLILHAAKLCGSYAWKSPYSYILVDEFQDISVDRYKFILSLRNADPKTKTYCVGDDWQSIYRFSGSDMNLFNHFEKYFGFTIKCKIETTYRFGNPLVARSSEFILKNPSQVQKVVHPLSEDVSTKLSFIPFSRSTKDEYLAKIKAVIDSIPANETVMLMGRYNYEVNVFPRSCVKEAPNSKRATVTFAGRTMQFMSVHAAKGLEADNVLILNCSQDEGGFPSRITDDPILGYVLSEIDTFEYSEERRLFYVAITRAKKHTFVLYNENMPSVFVTEMLVDSESINANTEGGEEQLQMLCPVCKKGRFKVVKEATAKNGNQYRFYLCSNSVAGCHNSWLVFYNDTAEIMPQYQDMVKKAEWQMNLERQRREALERQKKMQEEQVQREREDYERFIKKKYGK